jgi:opacity protein-like surface antigen
MNIIKYAIFIALLLCQNISIGKEVTKAGTTAAGFLNIDVGARAVSMGGAFVAMADDGTTMFWNPAGIARFTQPQANFTHMRWIADITFNYVGFALPMGRWGSLGLNSTFLTTDQMERTTVYSPMGTGEMFDVGSHAFGIGYAVDLTDRFSIGFNLKYIQEHIYHSSATGMAVDIGTLFDTRLNGLKIGMSITNYGTKMQMGGQDMLVQVDVDKSVNGNNSNINAYLSTDKYDLPLMFRVGVSMDVLKGVGDSNLNLSLDALHPNDDVESLNTGVEYIFRNAFALRGGYHSLFAKDSETGLTFGTGLMISPMRNFILNVDYAYMDFDRLDNAQMVTLSLKF